MPNYTPLCICVADEKQYDVFFNSLEIPSIDSATSSRLDEPFSIGELSSALMLMQSGKCPGPDGLPAEFYKTFSDQLAPILLNMFNESMQNGNLPPTISLLLKRTKTHFLVVTTAPSLSYVQMSNSWPKCWLGVWKLHYQLL